MRRRQYAGITLVETLLVAVLTPLLLIPVFQISLQTSRIFSTTYALTGPELSMNLALRRMEGETRRAVSYSIDADKGTWLQITLPTREAQGPNAGLNAISASTGLSADIANQIRYFLGVKSSDGRAVPSATGNTIFRATVSANTPANQSFALSAVQVIAEGVEATPQAPDSAAPTVIFSDDSSASPPLIRITLSSPIDQITPRGKVKVHRALWTQFCVRNAA